MHTLYHLTYYFVSLTSMTSAIIDKQEIDGIWETWIYLLTGVLHSSQHKIGQCEQICSLSLAGHCGAVVNGIQPSFRSGSLL